MASFFTPCACRSPAGSDKPAPFTPMHVKEANTWTMPFMMSPVNSQICHYSDALTNNSYGKDFRVLEVVALGSGYLGFIKSVLGTGLMGVAAALIFVKFLRPVADRCVEIPQVVFDVEHEVLVVEICTLCTWGHVT